LNYSFLYLYSDGFFCAADLPPGRNVPSDDTAESFEPSTSQSERQDVTTVDTQIEAADLPPGQNASSSDDTAQSVEPGTSQAARQHVPTGNTNIEDGIQPKSGHEFQTLPPGHAKLMLEWQALQKRCFNVPQFISKYSPGWEPGKYLSDEALFHLFSDSLFHEKFITWVKQEYAEINSFLEDHFDSNQIQQPYDCEATVANIVAGQARFMNLFKQKKESQADPQPLPSVLPEEIYTMPDNDVALQAAFQAHLLETKAKRKITTIHKATADSYMNSIFGNSSDSFKAFFKREYGDRPMIDLMLSYKRPHILLRKPAVEKYISPDSLWGGEMTASSANNRCAGLTQFIKFLTIMSEKMEIPAANAMAVAALQQYTIRFDQIIFHPLSPYPATLVR